MHRRIPEYLAVCFAFLVCGSTVWADEKPSNGKTESLGAGERYGVSVNSDTDRYCEATLDESAGKPVSKATKGTITVAWKNGQLSFPDTNEKASGLRLQCSGNVVIEGKGITAKTTNLDVTIAGQDSLKKAAGLNFRCAGGVRIEWKGMTVIATDMKFDGEKCLLTLSGDTSRPCILRSKNSDGTKSVLIAERVSLSSCGGKVECDGVKEYRASDTSPDGNPFVPGAYPGPYATPVLPGVYPAPYVMPVAPTTQPPTAPTSAPPTNPRAPVNPIFRED